MQKRSAYAIDVYTGVYSTHTLVEGEKFEWFPFGTAFPSLGKARVCKSSKAGKSFSVRCWSDKSSSISPCRHPIGLSSPSSFFSLLPPPPPPVSPPSPSLSRMEGEDWSLRESSLDARVCSSTLLTATRVRFPRERTRMYAPARGASARPCSPPPFLAYVGEGARALSFSRRIQCVRVKNTRYWSRVDARKRQEIRETGPLPLPGFRKLLSSPSSSCSSRERRRMWRYSAGLSIVHSWFARMNSEIECILIV